MVEKIITLENISLIDFLGVENSNIKEVAQAFPKGKIISRGNEIKLQGNRSDIVKMSGIIESLVKHYHKYGKLSQKNIKSFIEDKQSVGFEETMQGALVHGPKGIVVKPKTKNQKKIVEASKKSDLVFVIGPAGTGKTYISVALAVMALKNKEVKKIIITRPAVEAGESLGFLPGDLKDKIDPYLRPVYDALDDMIHHEKLNYYIENRIIEIAPLAYMRGRTLGKAFVLLDEAQNTTPMQIKMFLTRIGQSSKVIVNGDVTQIDLPKHQKSGLAHAMSVLKDINEIKFVKLASEDVVRHKIVKKIIDAYEKAEN